MKKYLSIAVLLFFAIAARASDPLKISVSKLTENRQVSDFSGVAASGNVNVLIKFGSSENLRLEGEPDAIAELVTEVKGGVLNIRPKTKIYWNNKFRTNKVTAYITVKKLNMLVMSGSGEIRVDGLINTSKFTATLTGSGSIKANISASTFVGTVSGSGKLHCSGRADNGTVVVSGSGDFLGKDLSISRLTAVVSGSGNVNARVNSNLKATVNGSGNVFYSGNARVEKTTIGSGNVRKV